MNSGVGAWPCAHPAEGDHKGRPYSKSLFVKLLGEELGEAL
jgi:hypothetical protein